MKFFAEMLTKDGSSREDEFSEEQERARMSAGYVYVSVSVLTSFFTEDCLFKRATGGGPKKVAPYEDRVFRL